MAPILVPVVVLGAGFASRAPARQPGKGPRPRPVSGTLAARVMHAAETIGIRALLVHALSGASEGRSLPASLVSKRPPLDPMDVNGHADGFEGSDQKQRRETGRTHSKGRNTTFRPFPQKIFVGRRPVALIFEKGPPKPARFSARRPRPSCLLALRSLETLRRERSLKCNFRRPATNLATKPRGRKERACYRCKPLKKSGAPRAGFEPPTDPSVS